MFNRISRFSNNDFLPRRGNFIGTDGANTTRNIPGVKITHVEKGGEKIDLGSLGLPKKLSEAQPSDDFLLDKEQFVKLMGLRNAAEKEYFQFRVTHYRQVKDLPFTVENPKQKILEDKFDKDTVMYVDDLALIYTQIEADTDHSLKKHSQTLFDVASLYEKKEVADAIVDLSDGREFSIEKTDIYKEVCAKEKAQSNKKQAQDDLLEMLRERQGFAPTETKLSSIDDLERAVKTVDLDTELSSEFIAEYMGLRTEEELDLYKGLRKFHTQNSLLGLFSEPKSPKDCPGLLEAAKKLGNKQEANYINNLAKLASDAERDENPASFEKYGPKLLKIASAFGKKDLANQIFDILPNIYLKDQ